jgi:hypothetical protein
LVLVFVISDPTTRDQCAAAVQAVEQLADRAISVFAKRRYAERNLRHFSG